MGNFNDFLDAGCPLDSSLEPQPGGVADTLATASYITDLQSGEFNKDIATRGLEHPALSKFAPRATNLTTAGTAEVTPLLGMPTNSQDSVVVFYLRGPEHQIYVRVEPIGGNQHYQQHKPLQVIDRLATDQDAQRWPKQWHALLNSTEMQTLLR